jgi:hypothetical protein
VEVPSLGRPLRGVFIFCKSGVVVPQNIKKYRKKLRGREFIEVDGQIALWRKRLKKRGITIGKNTEKRDEVNKKQREAKALERAVKKNGFFG